MTNGSTNLFVREGLPEFLRCCSLCVMVEAHSFARHG
jgi:hypothetical protein